MQLRKLEAGIWPVKEGNSYQWLEELKVIDWFSVRNEVGLSMLQEDKELKILLLCSIK